MLDVKNLTFSYPHFKKPVIDDMSFSLPAGAVCGLLGPNGVGKSTLLYLISGLLTPQSGSTELFGINTRLRRPDTLSQLMIVPEEIFLPNITLKEYVKWSLRFYPRFSAEDLRRHLATFGFDENLHLGRLSMGQKKKAFLCFALAANTSLLLMDEPTNGLDIPGKVAFRSFIASAMTDERSIIISTHQVADINQLIDHLLIMDQNRLLLDSSVAAITRAMAFRTTTDPAMLEQALVSINTPMGYDIIVPNDTNEETEIRLEPLFQLATTRPETVKRLLSYSCNETHI